MDICVIQDISVSETFTSLTVFFFFKINLQLILELRSRMQNLNLHYHLSNSVLVILIIEDTSSRIKELNSVVHFLMACITFNQFLPTTSITTKNTEPIFFIWSHFSFPHQLLGSGLDFYHCMKSVLISGL